MKSLQHLSGLVILRSRHAVAPAKPALRVVAAR
jgi:hypothetical protein